MHRLNGVTAFGLAVLVLAACTKSNPSATDTGAAATAAKGASVDKGAAEKEIRAGDSAYFAAVAAKNPDGMAAGYATDAVSMAPGMPAMHGRDEIKKGSDGMLKTPGFAMTGATETVTFSDDGSLAYATGKYTAKYNDPKGKPVTEQGKYLEVLKNVDGKWLVVADAFNADKM